jgi:hypothetical protein
MQRFDKKTDELKAFSKQMIGGCQMRGNHVRFASKRALVGNAHWFKMEE